MRVLMVTGTDTEVGKTVVTAAVAASARAAGLAVAVVKPAQTGVGPDEPGDLAEVVRLAGPVATYEGVRLPDPLAPVRAAARAGVALPTLEEQRDLVLGAGEGADLVLVEGAGGVTVELGDGWAMVELGASLAAAGAEVTWLVATRAGLGTLNHTQLTVEHLRAAGQQVGGLVVGCWPARPGLAEEGNREDLPRVSGVPLLGAVPAGAPGLPVGEFRASATAWLPDPPFKSR